MKDTDLNGFLTKICNITPFANEILTEIDGLGYFNLHKSKVTNVDIYS